MKSQPKNLEGLLFKENEAGYLVGYMAGLYVKDKGGDQAISGVGGQQVPPVDAYIAGFQEGARPRTRTSRQISPTREDFVAQAKCKEIALNQIAEGSQVVFAVAGRLRPRRARRGQGEGHAGHRRRCRPGLPR